MDQSVRPLIILVHGIRDIARWEVEIADTLRHAGFDVELTNYGRMNLLEFLLPIPYFREKAIETIWTQIQQARMLHPEAPISIIAHSFGTYIVANILRRQFTMKVDRIIFCGSVVRFKFPFEQINDRFNSPVLNEVGTADPWPAVAESVTTGYGSAGTYGFLRPGVRDRFHNDAGHGYFLNAKFCRDYWIKFLAGEPPIPGDSNAKDPPLWVRLISIFKIKYFIVLAFILAAAWLGARAAWGPEPRSYSFEESGSQFVPWNDSISRLRADVAKSCWMPKFLCDSEFLTRAITGRTFRNVAIFDGAVKDIVSCDGFRFPTDRRTTNDPNEALQALARKFPLCISVIDINGGADLDIEHHSSMTPVDRPQNTTAYLCGCTPSQIDEFRRIVGKP
jgi:hypothetical protein